MGREGDQDLTAPGQAPLEIVPWHPRHGAAFRDLNLWWLRRWFRVEPIDEAVLAHPQTMLIDAGGEILFALRAGEVLGTVALKDHGEGRFELTKLAVDPEVHRDGIGRALCEAVIVRFHTRGGACLFLETNSVLEPAIRLYEALGFEHLTPPLPSPYQRANVYMELGAAGLRS